MEPRNQGVRSPSEFAPSTRSKSRWCSSSSRAGASSQTFASASPEVLLSSG